MFSFFISFWNGQLCVPINGGGGTMLTMYFKGFKKECMFSNGCHFTQNKCQILTTTAFKAIHDLALNTSLISPASSSFSLFSFSHCFLLLLKHTKIFPALDPFLVDSSPDNYFLQINSWLSFFKFLFICAHNVHSIKGEIHLSISLYLFYFLS